MDTIGDMADELIARIRCDLTATEHGFINSALRAAYARGKADVLEAITHGGPDGEIYNGYVGGTDLREFLP